MFSAVEVKRVAIVFRLRQYRRDDLHDDAPVHLDFRIYAQMETLDQLNKPYALCAPDLVVADPAWQ